MPFFDTAPQNLAEADLVFLVDNRIQEDDRLEFKRDMYATNDEGRRELLRDVVAMANHLGGRLVIGVDEDDEGRASAIVGVAPGVPPGRREPWDAWLRSLCLAGIDQRIVGLSVHEVPVLAGAKVAVVVDVPRSGNAPHMVTFGQLHQFWARGGREKRRLSAVEVHEAVRRAMDNESRVAHFLGQRDALIMADLDGAPCMVVSATPAFFRPEVELLDTRLNGPLSPLMLNPPAPPGSNLPYPYDIRAGAPYLTLEGLRADRREHATVRRQGEQWRLFLEAQANGYLECGWRLPDKGDYADPRPYAQLTGVIGRGVSIGVLSFLTFAARVLGEALPGGAVDLRLRVLNARGVGIRVSGRDLDSLNRVWQREAIDSGIFRFTDLEHELLPATERLCDRIWRAFGYASASLLDANGELGWRYPNW